MQKLGLTEELTSVNSYSMIILSFQSQFLVSGLVKWWLIVINFVLVVVSNYLINVKQCLTMFLFKKLFAVGNIFIRSSENKRKTIETEEILSTPTVNSRANG